MNNPLVSVACTTYNHEKYIAQAIEGFLLQKISFPIEIIIHDDASTDNTKKIVEQYAKINPNLIFPIYQQVNQYSLGKKMFANYVFPNCRGKYIALCEGDDYWTDPLKLQKQVDFLESHPDYCLVHSDFNTLIDKKNKIYPAVQRKKNLIIPTGKIFEDLLVKNTIATLTVCCRSDVLKKVADYELFEKKGFLSGDFPLWLGMSRHGKIHYIDEPLATYRVLDESASHSKDPQKVLKVIKSTYNQTSYFVEKYGCSEETKKMVNYNYNNSLLKYSFLLRDKNLGEMAYDNLLNHKRLEDKICLKQKLFYYGSRNIFNWYIVALFRKVKRTLEFYWTF